MAAVNLEKGFSRRGASKHLQIDATQEVMTEDFSADEAIRNFVKDLDEILQRIDETAEKADTRAAQICGLAAAHIQMGADILREFKAA